MDRGKKPSNFFGKTNKTQMDLKDIVRENALPFLPAKSLFRCSGVCRDWKLQISTPFFAHSQSNYFCSTSGFFCQSPSGLPSFISLDPMAYGVPDPSLEFLPEPVDIRASSNGLLCCQGRTENKAYYICNPVTKQWKILPKPEADHGPDPAIVLIFEPSLLNFFSNYKLVCAFPSELEGYEFEIYSSEKGSWRISGEICFGDRKLLPSSGVYVNGTVYWLSTQEITAFDLTTERVQLLSYAPGCLGMTDGKLCASYVQGKRLYLNLLLNTHANTMQMRSNDKAWSLVTPEIDLDISLPVNSQRSYFSQYDYCFAHHKSVEGVVFVDDDVVLIRASNTLYSYDRKKKATASLGELHTDARIFSYVNSLVEL